MLIVCPSCASSYEVQPDKLGSAGRSVRCARCRTTWFAAPASGRIAPAAASDRPRARTPGAEQIEGGEFGWTFAPEGDGFDKHGLPAADEPAPAPSDQASALEARVTETESEFLPDEPEPVMISDAPTLAPELEEESGRPGTDEATKASADIETLAAWRAKRPALSKRRGWRPGVPIVVIALAAVAAALLGGRQQVVSFLPQTAPLFGAIGLPVNLRGLAFENVKTSYEASDGVTVLVVEGSIVNVAKRTVEVPRLRFGLRNGAGLEIYAWTSVPARTILAPGEAVEFRSRLASPPVEGRNVVVRFFNRRDIVAGNR